jgi:ADP-ribose pyrophosphatase YjhB (NUDIX family)
MKFCSSCGATVSHKVPDGDHLPRYVCDQCATIHYQNPRIIAGCIAEWQDKILLCRRAIEPRYGLWTLPAGFMENRETTLQGALREAREEAQAQVINTSLFSLFSIPHISQVYMMYRGELQHGFAQPGTESLETLLFSETEIPWDELAFPVMRETLKLYYADKAQGEFTVHTGDLIRDDNQHLTVTIYR